MAFKKRVNDFVPLGKIPLTHVSKKCGMKKNGIDEDLVFGWRGFNVNFGA